MNQLWCARCRTTMNVETGRNIRELLRMHLESRDRRNMTGCEYNYRIDNYDKLMRLLDFPGGFNGR